MNYKYKVVVDCRMLGKSGIGVFIKNIIENLVIDETYDFYLLGDAEKIKLLDVNLCNCKIINFCADPFSLREQIHFPYSIVNKCDLYFTPNFNLPFFIKIPIISGIHDLLFLDVDRIVSKIGKFIRKLFLVYAFNKSNSLFTVSNFSKSRLIYHFGSNKKITILYNGIDSQLQKFFIANDTESLSNGDYVLYVGNVKPHKGINLLINAYIEAKNEGFNKKLVIVGNKNNFRTSLDLDEYFLRNNDIEFTGYLNCDKLYKLMYNASALIQPSIYEGFGIPPLEAMFLGTPAFISDIEVFKEIYANTPAQFFVSNDVNSLKNLLLNGNYDKVILSKNVNEKFSFANSSKDLSILILKTIHSYESIATR